MMGYIARQLGDFSSPVTDKESVRKRKKEGEDLAFFDSERDVGARPLLGIAQGYTYIARQQTFPDSNPWHNETEHFQKDIMILFTTNKPCSQEKKLHYIQYRRGKEILSFLCMPKLPCLLACQIVLLDLLTRSEARYMLLSGTFPGQL